MCFALSVGGQGRALEPARPFACPLGLSLIRSLLSSSRPGSPSAAVSSRGLSLEDPATDLSAESRARALLA